MKYLLLACALILSPFSFADDERGWFFGAGLAGVVIDDCDSCDADGYGFEVGYNVNEFVGIEAKYANTEFEYDSDFEQTITYVGVNVGHTFNTSWVRFYGKLGHLKLEEEDVYYKDKWSDSGFAHGIGAMFTPFAPQSGFYFKVDFIVAEIFEDDIGYGQIGAGFQF